MKPPPEETKPEPVQKPETPSIKPEDRTVREKSVEMTIPIAIETDGKPKQIEMLRPQSPPAVMTHVSKSSYMSTTESTTGHKPSVPITKPPGFSAQEFIEYETKTSIFEKDLYVQEYVTSDNQMVSTSTAPILLNLSFSFVPSSNDNLNSVQKNGGMS